MRILLAEDNPDHQLIIEECVDDAFGADSQVVCVDTFAELPEKLLPNNVAKADQFDIALIDLGLPDSPLSQTVSWLGEHRLGIPTVVLTSLDDEDLGAKLVRSGVDDYLPKSNLTPSLLHRVCRHAIERKGQRMAMEAQYENMVTFCRSLSNDFNGSLVRISQLIELLDDALEESHGLLPGAEKYMRFLAHTVQSVSSLALGLSHSLTAEDDKANVVAVDLNEIVTDVCHRLQQQFAGCLRWRADDLPTIEGDKSQLTILFQNIIENGIKFNEREPFIQIKSEINAEEYSCTLSVIDNGIGMEQRFAQEIFEPFVRLHGGMRFSGSGLGLSIVKRVVENHGGEIGVVTGESVGSTFKLTLPLKMAGADG